jgi:hypothetical protein
MPVNEDGCGLSKETIDKADMIDDLGFILNIVEIIWRKRGYNGMFPYQYIDLNCGPGAYYEGMLPNVASVFYRLFQKFSFPVHMHLIDKNPKMLELIANWVHSTPRIQVSYHCGLNTDIAPQIINALPNAKHGLLVSDPNGPKHLDELIKAIALLDKARYIDWLFHLSGTAINRARNCKKIAFNWFLTDYLEMTGKKRCLLKASPNRRDKWLLAFATNFVNMGEWKGNGWFFTDKPDGRELLRYLNLSKDELNGRLFEEDESKAS